MPVILHPEALSLWLSHNMHDPEQLKQLYQQFPSEQLQTFISGNESRNKR